MSPFAKWKPSRYRLIAAIGGSLCSPAAPASSALVLALSGAPGAVMLEVVLPPPQAYRLVLRTAARMSREVGRIMKDSAEVSRELGAAWTRAISVKASGYDADSSYLRGKRADGRVKSRSRAPVAQWIERPPPKR